MTDFSALLDSFPEGWRPKPGDKLIGVIIGIEARTTEYGTYPIVTIRTDSGADFGFRAFRTVARREVEKLKPKVGDRIGRSWKTRPATPAGWKTASAIWSGSFLSREVCCSCGRSRSSVT
jgi:hypothetical protein